MYKNHKIKEHIDGRSERYASANVRFVFTQFNFRCLYNAKKLINAVFYHASSN